MAPTPKQIEEAVWMMQRELNHPKMQQAILVGLPHATGPVATEETPMTEESTTTTATLPADAGTGTKAVQAAADKGQLPKSKGKGKPAAKPAAKPAVTVTRSRQGVGARKGETVRIVRRKNEEKDGTESWHIWQKDTNRNVVPTRFPSEAAARAHAKKEGWVAANSKGEVAS